MRAYCLCSEGGKPGSSSTCNECQGRGVRVQMRMIGPGMVQQSHQTCPLCQGQGFTIPEKLRCKACAGKRTTKQEKLLEVPVPRGAPDNHRITFYGEGDQGVRHE